MLVIRRVDQDVDDDDVVVAYADGFGVVAFVVVDDDATGVDVVHVVADDDAL